VVRSRIDITFWPQIPHARGVCGLVVSAPSWFWCTPCQQRVRSPVLACLVSSIGVHKGSHDNQPRHRMPGRNVGSGAALRCDPAVGCRERPMCWAWYVAFDPFIAW